MEQEPATLVELVKQLPSSSAKYRKPLRCVITEAVRDKKIADVPAGLVENDNVAAMLEQDFHADSKNLTTVMESQAGAEEALARRIFLETNPPINQDDQIFLQKV